MHRTPGDITRMKTARQSAKGSTHTPGGAHSTRSTSTSTSPVQEVTTTCTAVCGDNSNTRRSSSLTLLAVSTFKNMPEKALRAYVILDMQSSNKLVDKRVMKYFGVRGTAVNYILKSASDGNQIHQQGHVLRGLGMKGVMGSTTIHFQSVLIHPGLVDNRHEVATPSMALAHKHTHRFANSISDFEPDVPVL